MSSGCSKPHALLQLWLWEDGVWATLSGACGSWCLVAGTVPAILQDGLSPPSTVSQGSSLWDPFLPKANGPRCMDRPHVPHTFTSRVGLQAVLSQQSQASSRDKAANIILRGRQRD